MQFNHRRPPARRPTRPTARSMYGHSRCKKARNLDTSTRASPYLRKQSDRRRYIRARSPPHRTSGLKPYAVYRFGVLVGLRRVFILELASLLTIWEIMGREFALGLLSGTGPPHRAHGVLRVQFLSCMLTAPVASKLSDSF